MILDIGCGENPWFKGREDVINLDIRPIRGVVHIIADAKKLPIKNNAFDHVFFFSFN
jgi:ubiquinone/menaquinone biosynthesis C-methylase UbiE